jgi:hypothetical protein
MIAMDREKAGSAAVHFDRQVLLVGLLISSVVVVTSMSFASSALQDSARSERAKTNASSQANSEITAIDKSNHVVSAKVTSDGQRFQFTPASDAELSHLTVGQRLLANFETRQVYADGGHLAGRITTKGLEKPSANGLPNKTAVPVWNKAIITDINSSTGNVTARDSLTNKSFQFRAANTAIFGQLRLRQTVLVNFAGRQVSFDGKAALGAVTKPPE